MTLPNGAQYALGDGYTAPQYADDYDIKVAGVFTHNANYLGATELQKMLNEILLLTQTSGNLTAYNNTGSTLTVGTLVYPSWDLTNDRWQWNRAVATTSTWATHVIQTAILNTAAGIGVRVASIAALDTSGWTAEGDPVYLDPTTPGAFTKTAPTGAAEVSQRVGYVKVKNASGTIGFRLEPPIKWGTNNVQDLAITFAKMAISATNPCLQDATGLQVKTDESTIERAAGGLQIKNGGVSAAKLASGVLALSRTLSISHDSEGDTGANIIRFSIQVMDGNGTNLAEVTKLQVWVGTADKGAPAGVEVVTVSTGTLLFSLIANQFLEVQTDATGLLNLDISIIGAGDRYVMAAMEKVYSSQGTWA